MPRPLGFRGRRYEIPWRRSRHHSPTATAVEFARRTAAAQDDRKGSDRAWAWGRVSHYAVILSLSDSEERTPSDSDGARRHEWRLGILWGQPPKADHANSVGEWAAASHHGVFVFLLRQGHNPPLPPLYTRGAFSRVPRPLGFRGKRYEIPWRRSRHHAPTAKAVEFARALRGCSG